MNVTERVGCWPAIPEGARRFWRAWGVVFKDDDPAEPRLCGPFAGLVGSSQPAPRVWPPGLPMSLVGSRAEEDAWCDPGRARTAEAYIRSWPPSPSRELALDIFAREPRPIWGTGIAGKSTRAEILEYLEVSRRLVPGWRTDVLHVIGTVSLWGKMAFRGEVAAEHGYPLELVEWADYRPVADPPAAEIVDRLRSIYVAWPRAVVSQNLRAFLSLAAGLEARRRTRLASTARTK